MQQGEDKTRELKKYLMLNQGEGIGQWRVMLSRMLLGDHWTPTPLIYKKIKNKIYKLPSKSKISYEQEDGVEGGRN